MADELDIKMMKWAEDTSDIIVERIEGARVLSPEKSTSDLFNEMRRNSHMGPKTAELARMKLGIV